MTRRLAYVMYSQLSLPLRLYSSHATTMSEPRGVRTDDEWDLFAQETLSSLKSKSFNDSNVCEPGSSAFANLVEFVSHVTK